MVCMESTIHLYIFVTIMSSLAMEFVVQNNRDHSANRILDTLECALGTFHKRGYVSGYPVLLREKTFPIIVKLSSYGYIDNEAEYRWVIGEFVTKVSEFFDTNLEAFDKEVEKNKNQDTITLDPETFTQLTSYFKIRVHLNQPPSSLEESQSKDNQCIFDVIFSGIAPFDMESHDYAKGKRDEQLKTMTRGIEADLKDQLKDRFNSPLLAPNTYDVAKMKTIKKKVNYRVPFSSTEKEAIVSELKDGIINELDTTKSYLCHFHIDNRQETINIHTTTTILHVMFYYSSSTPEK